jgi:hypothetical protein
MDSHEIAPLKCPSCGSSMTGPSRPVGFGAEFSCAHCGSTSVLIINRALLSVDALHKSGDQVCAVCGRVAKVDARFCQDGHKLVRTCLNYDCGKEFPAHHSRCDYCGLLQGVAPGTPEAADLVLELAIRNLSDPSRLHFLHDFAVIEAAGRRAKKAVASIVRLMQTNPAFSPGGDQEFLVVGALTAIGEDARDAAPVLLQRINSNPKRYWSHPPFVRVLASIAPQEALPICRREIEAEGRNPTYSLNHVLPIAELIGKAAIPMLLEFCGVFSGNRGTLCQATVNRISKSGR